MKKWQIILTIVLIILTVAVYFFIISTDTFSARAVAVGADEPIGMAPFPDRLDFGDIPAGKSVIKTITLTNNGDNDNHIKIFIIGSINSLIQVTPGTSVTLKAGETLDIDFRLNMPASAPVGKKWTGKIILLTLP